MLQSSYSAPSASRPLTAYPYSPCHANLAEPLTHNLPSSPSTQTCHLVPAGRTHTLIASATNTGCRFMYSSALAAGGVTPSARAAARRAESMRTSRSGPWTSGRS